MQLIKDNQMEYILDEVYEQCKKSYESDEKEPENYVKRLYDQFTYEEISQKIGDIVRPDAMQSELKIIYQTVENLHKACPHHLGDWYFTGNFPTPGGSRVVNKSFMNFMEGKLVRAY